MITFTTSTLADAVTAGCDCVQIKYDGMFTQVSCNGGKFTATSREHKPETFDGVSPDVNCTLVASYRPVLTKFYVFDCWLVEEPPSNIVDLRREPYRSRYVATRIQLKLLNSPFFHLVQNHPIANAKALWQTIQTIPNAKGLVFRNSKDPVGVPLRCARWYPELPGELI